MTAAALRNRRRRRRRRQPNNGREVWHRRRTASRRHRVRRASRSTRLEKYTIFITRRFYIASNKPSSSCVLRAQKTRSRQRRTASVCPYRIVVVTDRGGLLGRDDFRRFDRYFRSNRCTGTKIRSSRPEKDASSGEENSREPPPAPR